MREDLPGATQVIGTDSEELRAQLEGAIDPVQTKLDPVLGGNIDLISDGWANSTDPNKAHGNISSRVRDLSYKYHEQQAHRSYMLDALLLFVAMIFGIGFGCVVLKLLFPSILFSLPFLGGKG